jgi:hypothetical protein
MVDGKVVDNGDSETRDDSVFIQWVVREVGGGTAFPVLTKSNYTEWTILMKVKLKAWGLWVTVEKGEADPQEDMMVRPWLRRRRRRKLGTQSPPCGWAMTE